MAQAERRVEASEREHQAVDATYTLTETDHAELRRLAGEIDVAFTSARQKWLYASEAFARAGATFAEASAEYAAIRREYDEAAAGFRRVTTMIILAAASDLFLRGVCGENVSTARHRRDLAAQGIRMEGKDVDHIVAHARGGPDRPWNYMLLDQSINRSLQDGGLAWKLMNYPLNTLDALAKNASYQLLCR